MGGAGDEAFTVKKKMRFYLPCGPLRRVARERVAVSVARSIVFFFSRKETSEEHFLLCVSQRAAYREQWIKPVSPCSLRLPGERPLPQPEQKEKTERVLAAL